MTSLSSLLGTKVVSRTTAEHLGELRDAVLLVPGSRIVAWQVGKGRKAVFVDHEHLTGMGAAAIVVDDEANLHPAADDVQQATLKGARSILGSRTLTDTGDELGPVQDVDLDTSTGAVQGVTTDHGEVTGDRLRGFGSYALVVAANAANPVVWTPPTA